MKYRVIAKPFHKVDVKNGRNTSFWFDEWSMLGTLMELTGTRGIIDMAISGNAILVSVLDTHRRRRHRVEILNNEDKINERRMRRSLIAEKNHL